MIKWPQPIDHLYILCDPVREPERATYLTKWLTTNNIDPSVYTLYSECYGTTLSAERAHAAYNPFQDRSRVELQRDISSYNLKPSEISLVINWGAAARRAVEAGHKTVMLFESDVLFSETFMEDLARAMEAIQSHPWDFLSISAGAHMRPSRPTEFTGPGWFRAPYYYHTRTADAMIFKVNMLEKIVRTLFPFAEVLDWELNYQLSLHKSISYWLDPPIIRQGSGKEYPTTLV